MKTLVVITLTLIAAVECSPKYIPTIGDLFECDSLGRVHMRELQNYKGLMTATAAKS